MHHVVAELSQAIREGAGPRRKLSACRLGFKLLDGRQRSRQMLGQFYQMPKLGNAHRRRGVPESIFRYDPVLRLAQDETDARLVVGMAEKVVDGGKIEVHFAGVLRLERCRLQVFCGAGRYVAHEPSATVLGWHKAVSAT